MDIEAMERNFAPKIWDGSEKEMIDPKRDDDGWYVVHTNSRHETKVESALRRKNIETFLPRITVPSRRRDRKLLLSVPLFPGYLFVHTELDIRTYYQIVTAKSVVSILRQNGTPCPVPKEKIDSIKTIVASEQIYYPWRYLENGRQVRVVEGPLTGIIGVILKKKDKKRRLVVAMELFQRSVAVELDDESVEPW
jgi:transcriptional antiterminator NusG